MSFHLDHNGVELYDIGHIDKVGDRCGQQVTRGPRRYRVHVGWTPRDRRNVSNGIDKRTWTVWGANRVAAKARRDPRNAEWIALESAGQSLHLGTMLAGESRRIEAAIRGYSRATDTNALAHQISVAFGNLVRRIVVEIEVVNAPDATFQMELEVGQRRRQAQLQLADLIATALSTNCATPSMDRAS